MEFGSENFFYTETTDIDLSFLNPMAKRRLSNVDKITLFLLNKCNIDNKNIKIVYASRFGELERLIKLINQYKNDNEVSPNNFGSSVHNSPIGQFCLLNQIKSGYTSIASEEDTFISGLIYSISLLDKNNVLYCYSDVFEDKVQGFSMFLSNKKNQFKLYEGDFIKDDSKDDFKNFIKFLNGDVEFISKSGLFKIVRNVV